MLWAKTPTSWVKNDAFCDTVRVWLALSMKWMAKDIARVSLSGLAQSTELSTDRVKVALDLLIQAGAIQTEKGGVVIRVEFAALACAPVDIENNVLSSSNIDKTILVSSTSNKTIGDGFFDNSFEEKNRLAKARGKAIAMIGDFFSDPSWDRGRRKKLLWDRLEDLFEDELIPRTLRDEILGFLKSKAERERMKVERREGRS